MDYRKNFMVEPGAKVRLSKIDPSYTGKHETHEKAIPEIQKHVERMDKLQYLLYADGSQSLLVVLQALDAAGKDGVIRHIMGLKLPPTRVDIADIRRKFHAAEREEKGGGKGRTKDVTRAE